MIFRRHQSLSSFSLIRKVCDPKNSFSSVASAHNYDTNSHAHYQAVVIGGGVVGASVLYHLARNGWNNVALIERAELTAGSTWHAAAGFHAQNKDSNIAGLQAYTIKLYSEIEQESGQSVGLKR